MRPRIRLVAVAVVLAAASLGCGSDDPAPDAASTTATEETSTTTSTTTTAVPTTPSSTLPTTTTSIGPDGCVEPYAPVASAMTSYTESEPLPELPGDPLPVVLPPELGAAGVPVPPDLPGTPIGAAILPGGDPLVLSAELVGTDSGDPAGLVHLRSGATTQQFTTEPFEWTPDAGTGVFAGPTVVATESGVYLTLTNSDRSAVSRTWVWHLDDPCTPPPA